MTDEEIKIFFKNLKEKELKALKDKEDQREKGRERKT